MEKGDTVENGGGIQLKMDHFDVRVVKSKFFTLIFSIQAYAAISNGTGKGKHMLGLSHRRMHR